MDTAQAVVTPDSQNPLNAINSGKIIHRGIEKATLHYDQDREELTVTMTGLNKHQHNLSVKVLPTQDGTMWLLKGFLFHGNSPIVTDTFEVEGKMVLENGAALISIQGRSFEDETLDLDENEGLLHYNSAVHLYFKISLS